MDPLTSVEIVGAVGRRPERRWWKATGVSTDSRRIEEGSLFVALAGERYDGHNFVCEALEQGAVAAIVSKQVTLPERLSDRPLIQVPNTRKALGDIARMYRKRWGGIVVAVTGSNGKTTCKEMAFEIVSAAMPAKRSPASFNNDVGVPLTIFQIDSRDKVLVLEMATSAPGEIRYLADIARPDMVLITNIAETHLEGLGSVEGVMEAKAEVFERLGPAGVAILNADDPWTPVLIGRRHGLIMTYGTGHPAMVHGENVHRARTGFRFSTEDGTDFELRVPGEHNVLNALGAIAVGRMLQVGPAAMAEALRRFRLPPMRLSIEENNGLILINDAYNANVGSMRAALAELDSLDVEGRKVMVCGDMLELGEQSDVLHRELGEMIAASTVDVLWAIGGQSAITAYAARFASGSRPIVIHTMQVEDAVGQVAEFVREGDAVLVKASRAMRLERIVHGIRSRFQSQPRPSRASA